MADDSAEESTVKSAYFGKTCKKKGKYRSKKVKSRRRQLKVAREVKQRARNTPDVSSGQESNHERPSGLLQGRLEEEGFIISPPAKRSRSEQKLCKESPVSRKRKSDSCKEKQNVKDRGFVLIDIEILDNILVKSAVCIDCKQGALHINEQKKDGLARKLSLICDCCGFTKKFTTSSKCTEDIAVKGTPGPKTYEVNYRFVLGMRLIGKGLSGMNMLCGILNMPHAMKQSSYERILEKLEKAAANVATNSMMDAAKELNPSPDTVVDAKCMFDGTWQKRGFSSLIGGVSCISVDTGKVIDFEILQKYCRKCRAIEMHDNNAVKFYQMKLMHKCNKNYTGSSPGMEVDGVRRIFRRSVATRKLRYTHYIGDGDSKTFEAISQERPYGDNIQISKLECVGHVQKRVGNNLRKLKAVCGNDRLADGKTIGGKGRLSSKEIDQLQLYFGLAIRRNIGNIELMKKSIDAILRHRVSTDEMHNHTLCPEGRDSWCGFQRKLSASSEPFHHKIPLAKAIAWKIKPIFDRLSSHSLLQRCVDGYTQNAAESFNSVLWHICPKTTYVGLVPINLCASLATIVYNDGYVKLQDVLSYVGIGLSNHTQCSLDKRDYYRIYQSKRRASEVEKRIRQGRRKRRLVEEEKQKEVEGTVYESGAF